MFIYNRMPKISVAIKRGLLKYNLNYPIDRRTKDYKNIVIKYGNELKYIDHLNNIIKNAKKKELKQIKFYEKQVELQNYKQEIYNKYNDKRQKAVNKIIKGIDFLRNKIFRVKPLKWNSVYKKYILDNPNIKYDEDYYNLFLSNPENILKTISTEEFNKYINFYKIKEFMKQKLMENKGGIKMNLSFSLYTKYKDEMIISIFNKILKGKNIYNNRDIDEYITEFINSFNKLYNRDYLKIASVRNIGVMTNKIKPLNAKSYIPLPEWIFNKKAVINIKNEKDNKCFIYSVLCGFLEIYKKSNPERLYHYYNHMNLLKYDDKDLPMDLNKIIYFEKRNNLKINVFGVENKSIYPLYVSSNRNNENLIMINLLFINDDKGNNHYCYIKNFDRLMATNELHHKNMVCPYCCHFRTTQKNAFENHIKFCISGQKVEVPLKEDYIYFKKFSNLNECPIRIYADFESIKDISSHHKSKNGNTDFIDSHIGVSYKILVVSDIPINLESKKVNEYYIYSYIYKGLDANENFIIKIQELEEILTSSMKKSQEIYLNKIIMTNEDNNNFKNSYCCNICNNNFNNDKVKHHNHFTGKYIGALCSNCNIQIKDKLKIPVFFHNLNYDKNIFFKSFHHFKNIDDINILPDNEENYKCFTIKNLHFLDSFKFMSSSLDSLIKNIPNENKIFLKSLCNNEKEFEYMNKKGYFPYEWFDDINKLKLPIENLKIENFDNKMKMENLEENEWFYIKELIKDLNFKTFEDYHDFYLNIDVNGLADVFENFRKTSIKTYKLDPCHYVGTPSYGWDAMLLMTKTKLELLKDSEMYQFFERGIRGGQSVIFKKYHKANNKYLSTFNPNEKSTFISYLDANNLYGKAMSYKLPISNFKWIDGSEIDEEIILDYDINDNNGIVLEVDLEYPKELHKLHNDYPLCPERFKPEGSLTEKLCGTFYEKKNYIIHIYNLQLYIKLGMKINKIHRGISFKQSEWLKEWININTNFRKEAKNDFEKDYFKLMNNAVFGKTMENVRDRKEIKICFNEEYAIKYTSKPCFNHLKILNEKMSLLNLDKKTVKLDKPIYAGFSILDLSKYHMYNFHYNIMKPKYGENLELMMTDTDSLLYKIETNDFYKDMYEMKEYFDMSEYSKENSIYDETNKKVIGMFKDETGDKIISEYVGIRSKMYAFNTENPINLEIKTTKKLKGIPKVIVKKCLNFDDYKKCVLEDEVKRISGIIGFRTKDLTNYTMVSTKIGLKNADDKRKWEGINSYGWGY